MSRQPRTIHQPDNAWASRLKQQLTVLDLRPEVLSDELGIGRATLYRMLSGQLLPRPGLWRQILRRMVLHSRSALCWREILAWDADWAALTSHQQPHDAYQLLGHLFDRIPGTLLARMLQYLSDQPDDRVVLPLIRDYQSQRELNQATRRELESWLTERERQTVNEQAAKLLPQISEAVEANRRLLAQHQLQLADIDDFAVQLARLNEALMAHTRRLQRLVEDVTDLNAWRDDVDRSITALDQKIEGVSLPALWIRLWLATGQRWYGAALDERWQWLIEVGVGVLVIGLIVAFFLWLPAPYRDNPVVQTLFFGLLLVIVLWESGRMWLAHQLTEIDGESQSPESSDDSK